MTGRNLSSEQRRGRGGARGSRARRRTSGIDPGLPPRPKRAVLITPGMAEAGGAARRSEIIAEGMVERGWVVRAVTRSGTRSNFKIHRRPGMFVLEVPGFHRPRLGALLFFATAVPLATIWGVRSDVFLAVQLMSTTTVASLCSALVRVPFIAFSTTSGDLSEVAYLASRRGARLRRRLLERAHTVVAQTSESQAELRRFMPQASIEVIPNPVRTIPSPPPLSGRAEACFAGRFSAEKDLALLLRVWARLAEGDSAARLVLVGAGGGYRSVEADLRRQVGEHHSLLASVTFTGWVSEPRPYVETCDVFVFPSRSEGMSNALLEACASGRVIVASDITSNRSVLGDDYPLMFRAGDADDLERVLRAGLYERDLRERARLRALEGADRCSIDVVLDRIQGLLDAAVADSARHQLP